MRKVKCKCGCHSNPSIIHFHSCCENGEIEQSSRVKIDVEIDDREFDNLTTDQAIEILRKRHANELSKAIQEIIELKPLESTKKIKYETGITFLTDEELKEVIYKINSLSSDLKSMGLVSSVEKLNGIIKILK
jgi:Glu-tRNA(Gln) amidotransferase subunit E-like FAD-binding protein